VPQEGEDAAVGREAATQDGGGAAADFEVERRPEVISSLRLELARRRLELACL
jgi:hypothetical protein